MRHVNWTAILLGIVLTGCGADAGVDPEAVTTTAAVAETAATSSAPTTSVEATTTTEATGCDDAEDVDTLERGETYPMDVDGDGVDDQVTVYFDDSEGAHYGLLVEYASGGSARLDRPIYAVRQPLIPLGLYDIDGDGTGEMFVVEYPVDQGISYEPGSFTKVFIAQTEECGLASTGDQGALQLGHYPPQGSIARCEDGAVLIYDFYIETQDGAAFNVGVYEQTLSNGLITLTRLDSQEIAQQEMLDRPLLDCGDLQLPAERPPG